MNTSFVCLALSLPITQQTVSIYYAFLVAFANSGNKRPVLCWSLLPAWVFVALTSPARCLAWSSCGAQPSCVFSFPISTGAAFSRTEVLFFSLVSFPSLGILSPLGSSFGYPTNPSQQLAVVLPSLTCLFIWLSLSCLLSLPALQNCLALLDHVAPSACPGANTRGDLQVGRKSSLRSDVGLCEPS